MQFCYLHFRYTGYLNVPDMKHFILILSIAFSATAVAQSFSPIVPDTTELRQLEVNNDYSVSRGYLYLHHYYELEGERDSIRYLDNTPGPPCAFHQKFIGGIHFSTRNCSEEGGGDESIRFPKMKLETARKFINLLFYDEENEWQNETNYAPDGAGCHYSIIQKEDYTVISYYCGC